MNGLLIKRNKQWLVEFTTDLGAPNLLPLHPDDEVRLSIRSDVRFDDLDGAEVEFSIVEYNKKGSAYNNYPYSAYAKLSPGISPSVMLTKLKQHLNSINSEQFQKEIDDINNEFGFECSLPDCPHCAYEQQERYEEELEKEAAIDFAKWLAKDWMSIWVEDRWMWECINEQSELYTKYEYLTEEQLYELYLKDTNEI